MILFHILFKIKHGRFKGLALLRLFVIERKNNEKHFGCQTIADSAAFTAKVINHKTLFYPAFKVFNADKMFVKNVSKEIEQKF